MEETQDFGTRAPHEHENWSVCNGAILEWHTAFADERNLDVQSQQWYEVDCDMQMEDQWKGRGEEAEAPNEYLLVPLSDSKV